MQIEKNDGGIRVKRELEAGYFQFVDMPLPAVMTIQSGINKLRYATLIGIKQAKNKPLRKVALAEVLAHNGLWFDLLGDIAIRAQQKEIDALLGA